MHADLHRFACTLYSVYVKTSRANYPSYHVSSFELCDFSCSHAHTHRTHCFDGPLTASVIFVSISFVYPLRHSHQVYGLDSKTNPYKTINFVFILCGCIVFLCLVSYVLSVFFFFLHFYSILRFFFLRRW